MDENWIKVQDRLPADIGWYKVRMRNGNTGSVPYGTKMSGDHVWIVPDPSQITHWLEK